MRVMDGLSELVALLQTESPLYVRWSRGPGPDLRGPASVDDLTGTLMPGLSVNPLDREPWGEELSPTLWVARRLYDYSHLREDRHGAIRPWVLRGTVTGRGPDNEPLLGDVEPIAWIGQRVIEEAFEEVARQRGRWGPLRRSG